MVFKDPRLKKEFPGIGRVLQECESAVDRENVKDGNEIKDSTGKLIQIIRVHRNFFLKTCANFEYESLLHYAFIA